MPCQAKRLFFDPLCAGRTEFLSSFDDVLTTAMHSHRWNSTITIQENR